MKTKVLIGYDGSESAKVAIDDLQWAGLPATEVEAEVLTVADVWPSPPPSQRTQQPDALPAWPITPHAQAVQSLADQAMREAATFAQEGAARVTARFPGWHVSAESGADSPYWALIKRAEAGRPDLIVVGSHGRSAVSRFFLGSVAQMAVNHAPCSVRIGRRHGAPGHAAGAPIRIVIGVDGSPDSAAAIDAVAKRKWLAGTEAMVIAAVDLRLLTVLSQPHTPAIAWMNVPEGDGRLWARRAVDRAVEQLLQAGLSVRGVVREGDPKKVLIHDAEQWGADCIFVGSQGLTGLQRFLIGSVSAGVAARAHCSVEVVRSAASSR